MAELDIVALVDQDFTIIKGDDKDYVFDVKDATPANVDVSSGYTARLQARVGRTGYPALDVTNADSLTMGDGKITLSLTAAETAALAVSIPDGISVTAPYELEITMTGSPNTVKIIASGDLTIQEKIVGDIDVVDISLNKTTLSIDDNATPVALVATVVPSYATDPTVTWTSSATAVATVSGGTVTTVAPGTTTITATAGTKTATCVVTVVAVRVTAVTLNKSTLSLTAGGATGSITATVHPSSASYAAVWASSDETVATVSGGTVTPLKAGTTNITATADGFTATCVVTVAAGG